MIIKKERKIALVLIINFLFIDVLTCYRLLIEPFFLKVVQV